ncbi:hypothetical protein BH20ACI2_BH20ACI2_22600 [soil metagenome]
MPKSPLFQKLFAPFLILTFSITATTQEVGSIPYSSQEVGEDDGIPVLIKHLPNWERQEGNLTFATSLDQIKAALGDRPILNAFDFVPGTEAVSAPYESGLLVIVEFASPQVATDTGNRITEKLAEIGDPSIVYRRIGNYSALVLDAPNRDAANSLLDEVMYEKDIHWLGDNPFRISAERAFVITTRDIFLSTVIVIFMGMGFSISTGIIAGIIFFRVRVRRRAAMTTHSDAGGMTRLNLDGLTPDIVPVRLRED